MLLVIVRPGLGLSPIDQGNSLSICTAINDATPYATLTASALPRWTT